MSSLLLNLLHFSRLLGSLGLNIKAVRTLDIVHALQHIDIGRRTDLHQPALVKHRHPIGDRQRAKSTST